MEKKERELLRVYDKEGQHRTLAVYSEMTCSDLIALFGKKVQGFQASGFRLCVEYAGAKRLIADQSEHPFSIAKELEDKVADDVGRMVGVSKVKFHSIEVQLVEELPKFESTNKPRKNTIEANGADTTAQQVRKASMSSEIRKSGEISRKSGEISRKSGEISARKSIELPARQSIEIPRKSSNASGSPRQSPTLVRKNSESTPVRKSSDATTLVRKDSVGNGLKKSGDLPVRKSSGSTPSGSPRQSPTMARKNSASSPVRKNSESNLKKDIESGNKSPATSRKSIPKDEDDDDHPAAPSFLSISEAIEDAIAFQTPPISRLTMAIEEALAFQTPPKDSPLSEGMPSPTPTTSASTTSTTETTSTSSTTSTPSTSSTTKSTSTPVPASSTTTSTTTVERERDLAAELSAYLLKKNKNSTDLALEPVWAYFRSGQGSNEPVLAIFENHESVDPTQTIVLSDAKYELSASDDCPFPFLTITSNGVQYVFTAETITEWHETLQLATKSWVPPPPAAFSPPQPQVRRSPAFVGIPMVSGNSLLLRKSELRSSLVLSYGEQTPQDRAIVAWVNFCCAKSVVSSPASIAEDLRDGLVFARVTEVLFDRKIVTKTPSSIFDYTHNANLSLESLQQVRAPTNGLIASDFAEAKQPHSMLSLLWSLFFFFVGSSGEAAAKSKIAEWCLNTIGKDYESRGLTYPITSAVLQDGTVYSALLNKALPNALDFDSAIKLEKTARIETVLVAAEKHLRVPKFLDESLLADDRVCHMYLGLIYLALTNSAKWTAFLDRVNSPPPNALTPQKSTPSQPSIIKGRSISATAGPGVSRAPRKLSSTSSKTSLTKVEQENTATILAQVKLKPVTQTAATKAPPPPSAPITHQLKKTDKIAPLLVAEGFHEKKEKAKLAEAAKATGKAPAKPAAKTAGGKAPAKIAAKPAGKAPAKVAAKPKPENEVAQKQEEVVKSEEPTPEDKEEVPKETDETSPQPSPHEAPSQSEAETSTQDIPAGVAVFDPLATTLTEEEKKSITEVVESTGGTAVYDSGNIENSTSSVGDVSTEIVPTENASEKATVENVPTPTASAPVESTPSDKVPVEIATAEQPIHEKASAPSQTSETKETLTANDEPSTETSSIAVYQPTSSVIPPSSNDQSSTTTTTTSDDYSEDDYYTYNPDYSSGEDSGGDANYTPTSRRAVQVQFQKDLKTRDTRMNQMKQWRQSIVPDGVLGDRLGPFLSHDEAIKAGQVVEDSDIDARGKYGRDIKPVKNVTTEDTTTTTTTMTTTTTTTTTAPTPTQQETNEAKPTTPTDISIDSKHEDDKEKPKEETKLEAKPEEKVEKKPEEEVETKLEEKVETNPEGKVVEKPEAKVEEKSEEKKEERAEDKTEKKEPQTEEKPGEKKAPETTASSSTPADEKKINRKTKPPRVVIRVTLEGFGEQQCKCFSIDPKTLAGDVCLMMAEKMKFTEIEVPEYGLFVVKNSLERLLDVDEEVMTAEVNVEKFVYKRNYENEGDRDRRLFLSRHRSAPFKFNKNRDNNNNNNTTSAFNAIINNINQHNYQSINNNNSDNVNTDTNNDNTFNNNNSDTNNANNDGMSSNNTTNQ